MRKLFNLLIYALFAATAQSQNVGIGTNTPNAALDVSSTTQGFLPPRMTIAQRDAIVNPATGLMIFCGECDEVEVYNGTIWKSMAGNAACLLPTLPGVINCGQVWAVTNLDVTTYRNGDPIPQIITWPPTGGGWCWYANNPAYASFGRLYNWAALNDPRGLAPVGWHIPTEAEWTTLSGCLGGAPVAGGKMKEAGIAHWGTLFNPNVDATNFSGFTGLGSGYRKNDGEWDKITIGGYWWSTTESTATSIVSRNMSYNTGTLNSIVTPKTYFISVRCVRD